MIERYQTEEMKKIWSLEYKLEKWLEVEILACEGMESQGIIPSGVAARIRENARLDVKRIQALEQETRHDVVAFTRAVSETLGSEKKYLHFGLTSSDVVDTALACLMKEALELVEAELGHLMAGLKNQARHYKNTVMIGRTHGVHAEPTTLGLKLALFYSEMKRNAERLARARETVSVGKLSGAVGTFAHLPPQVEAYVCDKLGLTPALVSNQILQRDRHAEMLCSLAILAGTMDKLATEIRHLQRTEVRELEEPFYQGQKGSSAMPHKRNPVNCEKISGLSRVIRGNSVASLENQPLWHERDISHSSPERIIIPDSTTLAHYLIKTLNKIVSHLHVCPKRMKQNISQTNGLIYSQQVLLALVEKGYSREEAYDIVQAAAMETWQKNISFKEMIARDERVTRTLSVEELDRCFDNDHFLTHIEDIFARLKI